jgi:tetratricopeptide (TPR) repeat protein
MIVRLHHLELILIGGDFMKNFNVFLILFLFVLAPISLVGCASTPTDELEMARTAMDKAIEKQASEYAPNDWDRAEMNWQMANALIRMGRYDEARDVLVKAVDNFDKARDVSSRRLESLKIEINSIMPVLNKEVESIQKASEDSKRDLKARKRIEAALPLIDEKVASMNASLDREDFLLARRYGQEALRYVQDLKKKLGINEG